MKDHVTLVDENDNEVGAEEKMAAHRSGKLHRAFSIFIFDSGGRLLMQKREFAKYHSGGLWSNTCCGHPRPKENRRAAARRRLKEEMGIDCKLAEIFSFVYRAELSSGLIEHEFDYVFFGSYDGEPVPNPEEVEDWKWVDIEWLRADVQRNPHSYTFWLAECLDRVIAHRRSP